MHILRCRRKGGNPRSEGRYERQRQGRLRRRYGTGGVYSQCRRMDRMLYFSGQREGAYVTDDGNTVRYSLDGIEYEYGSSSPQFASAAELLTQCIDSAGTAENVTVRKGTDKLTLSGTAGDNSYTLTLDGNGEITGISVGGYTLDCSGNPAPETSAPAVDVGKYLK